MAKSRVCSIPGCGKPHRARGWCATHYAWNRSHGAPKITRSHCSVKGCGRKHKAKGLCATHAWRLRNHGTTDASFKRVVPQICQVNGCGAPHESLGYCHTHYTKVRRTGTVEPLKRRAGSLKQFVDLTLAAEASQSCVVPPGYPSDDYHYFRHAAVLYGAHRYVCEQAHGPAYQPKLHAAHTCGRRGCINRNHLRWATTRENMQDKHAHGTHRAGEQMHQSKLTEAAVKLIRSGEAGSAREAAASYGVHIMTIWNVLKRKTWKHI